MIEYGEKVFGKKWRDTVRGEISASIKRAI